MCAEMETRLRESILRVLRPTLTQISELDHQQKELASRVDKHGLHIDKVGHLHHDVIKQGQLTQVMEETTASLANQVRDMETVYGRQYLNLQSTLDLQQTSLKGLQNDVVRLNREDSRIWEETSRLQQQRDEDVQKNKDAINGCHKRMDKEREELDGRIDIINKQRDELMEDLYGEDKGLTLLTAKLKDLTDFVSPIPSMVRRINETERGLKSLTQRQESFEKDFERNRTEWHQRVKQQDEEMNEMRATFKKQCNFLVAHNAEIMKDIRHDYHLEIARIQETRKEVGVTLKELAETSREMEETMSKERYRIDRVQREVSQDLKEMAKSQQAERAAAETEFRQLRTDVSEANEVASQLRPQVDSVSRLTGLLLEGCRVGCALAIQDFADRSHERWLCLAGERPEKPAEPLKPSELERKRQLKEDSHLQDSTEAVTDVRRGLMRSSYQPGQVLFSGHSFDRHDLLVLHSRLLQKAQQAYSHGGEKDQLSKAEATLSSFVSQNSSTSSVGSLKDGTTPRSVRKSDMFRKSSVLNSVKENVKSKPQKEHAGHAGSLSARAPRSKRLGDAPPLLNSTWQTGWSRAEEGPVKLKEEQLGKDWVKLPHIQGHAKEEPLKVATPPTSRPGTGEGHAARQTSI